MFVMYLIDVKYFLTRRGNIDDGKSHLVRLCEGSAKIFCRVCYMMEARSRVKDCH